MSMHSVKMKIIDKQCNDSLKGKHDEVRHTLSLSLTFTLYGVSISLPLKFNIQLKLKSIIFFPIFF